MHPIGARLNRTRVRNLDQVLHTRADTERRRSPRFGELTDVQRGPYLVTVAFSVTATVLLVALVAAHRALLRLGARRELVAMGQWLAVAGLTMLALAVVGVTLPIFETVAGLTAGIVAAVVATAMFRGVLRRVASAAAPARQRSGRAEGPVCHVDAVAV